VQLGDARRGGWLEPKTETGATGARFWPTRCGGAMRRVEGTLLGWVTRG
jgi:hypothetical protein